MVPRAVLMKFGLVSINTARQNISKIAVLVNTARQVNAALSKSIVNVARPMSHVSKTAHSTVKRPIHKNTTFKNRNTNQRVNIVKGKNVNTTRPKAVVNAIKGNSVNVVKASACWVWKPKTKVLDHVSKHNRNMSYLTDYEEIDGEYVAFRGNPKGEKITGRATKDETSGIFKSFITGIENLVDHKVKVIRCDNGTEFKNREMNQFYEIKGIMRQYSVARTPQQNGVAERRNRTLIEAARTMLADSKFPTTFWAKAVNTACYMQNRVLVVKHHNKTPYELFHGRTPTLSFMRPFGYPVTILNTIDHLGKFDGKADEGFFVGYSLNSKVCRVFNSRTRIVEENLHIRFSENTPNIVGSGPDWLFDIDALTRIMNYELIVAGTQSNGFAGTKASVNAGQARKETEPVKDYILLPLWTADPPFSTAPKSSHDDEFKPSSNDGEKVEEDSRKESEYKDQEKDDNITNNVNAASNVNAANVGNSTNNVNGTDNEFPFDPNMPDLEDNGTFEFSYGNEDDGILLCIKWMSKVLLYGKIEKEVYVCQPLGFEDPDFPDRVYKVEKALYGLHQAPRAWYETLSTYLLDNGFQRGKIDKTLFIKRHKGNILLVQVYVDDIIFGSTKKELCIAFKKLMHEKFQMSSMGELTFFLGLQVRQKKDGIFISQDKYVAKILKKFGFTKVKTASTPMETHKPLLKEEDGEEVDVHLYISMIGSLMYLTSSRPDIMFIVCACARYQVNPKVSHLHVVKRIFRYLKGQLKLGLWYPKDSSFDLVAYTDSDYAGASLDRKSTTGGCQFLGCRLISWQFILNTVRKSKESVKLMMEKLFRMELELMLVKTINGEAQLHALVDGKKIIITKASVRRDLQLADEEGVDCLPNSTIFEQLTLMGYEKIS
ncbi:putative ribonuclease H-like domain-containing protein [Tanacetum coccineum]